MNGTCTATYEEARTEVEKEIDAEVLARVKNGIALLEREHGPDWVDKIDLDVLDIADGSVCVLGQLYGGDYFDACARLFGNELDTQPPREHGFCATRIRPADDWLALQKAWEHVLTPRVTS